MPKAIKRNSRKRKNQKQKMMLLGILSGTIVAGLIFLLVWQLFLRGDKRLIGKWSVDDITYFEFIDHNSGKLTVPTKEFEFTYSLDDNRISIDFKDPNSYDKTYEYSFNNSDLILKESETQSFRLRKVN